MFENQKRPKKVSHGSIREKTLDKLCCRDVADTNAAIAAVDGLSLEDLEEKYKEL